MKAQIKATNLLVLAVALAVVAAIWAVWGAEPAQAIIVVDTKTGLFTLAQGEAARIHIVNTGEVGGIIPCTKVFDSNGNLLREFPQRSVAMGESASFVFHPPDPQQPVAIRIEMTVEGVRHRDRSIAFIPTLEVFETATGKTSVGQDFIIVVDT